MAYEKHTWETGEVITAEKLNNLEDGCNRTMYVTVYQDEDTLEEKCSKTSTEIIEAIENGLNVMLVTTEEGWNYVSHVQNYGTDIGSEYPVVVFVWTHINDTSCSQMVTNVASDGTISMRRYNHNFTTEEIGG